MLNTAQDWFFLTVLVCTGLAAVSWLTFAQLSMRPMERRMKADGIPNDFKWDGVGARISLYALAIIFPEKFALRFHRLMDVKLIRSYANKSDWWRSLFFLSITYTWIAIILVGVAVGGFD